MRRLQREGRHRRVRAAVVLEDELDGADAVDPPDRLHAAAVRIAQSSRLGDVGAEVVMD